MSEWTNSSSTVMLVFVTELAWMLMLHQSENQLTLCEISFLPHLCKMACHCASIFFIQRSPPLAFCGSGALEDWKLNSHHCERNLFPQKGPNRPETALWKVHLNYGLESFLLHSSHWLFFWNSVKVNHITNVFYFLSMSTQIMGKCCSIVSVV